MTSMLEYQQQEIHTILNLIDINFVNAEHVTFLSYIIHPTISHFSDVGENSTSHCMKYDKAIATKCNA
jgi:DNA-directed RNA polymerase subunit L